MTDTLCAVCEKRPTPDGYACSGCASKAAGHLAAIIELAPDARLVAAGLVRRGHGGGGGKPGSRPPLNDGATDALDAVTNAMTTLVREIADVRGLRIDWAGRTLVDPLVGACSWLLGQMEWLRHAVDDQGQPYAVAAFAEIAQCAGRLRGLVNGPAEQRYLGPCEAERQHSVECGETSHPPADWDCACWCHDDQATLICDGDIYGVRGAQVGRCRTCKAEVAQQDRAAWLDEQVLSSDLAWTAAGIADAYGLSVKTIRSWATERRAPNGVVLRRAKLATYWHNGTQLVPWVDPLPDEDIKARGDRLHYVSDVVQLADEAAERRAAEQVRKAQDSEAA